jgi:hypothetical protein
MPRSRARRSRARRSSRRSGRRRQPRSGSRYRGPGEMTTFGPFILNEQNSTEDVTKRLENLKQEIAELSEMSPHNAEAIAEMVTTMKLFPSIMNGNKVEMIKIEAIDQTGKVTQEEYIRLFFMNHVAVNTLLIKWTRQTTNYFHKILQTFQQLMISYMGHYQFFGCRETVSFLDDFLLNFIRIDERDRSVDVKGFADFLEFIDIGLDTGLQTYFTTKMQISLVRLVEEEQLNNKRKIDDVQEEVVQKGVDSELIKQILYVTTQTESAFFKQLSAVVHHVAIWLHPTDRRKQPRLIHIFVQGCEEGAIAKRRPGDMTIPKATIVDNSQEAPLNLPIRVQGLSMTFGSLGHYGTKEYYISVDQTFNPNDRKKSDALETLFDTLYSRCCTEMCFEKSGHAAAALS